LRLYIKKTSKSQKFKAIETKPIERKQFKWLETHRDLQYHLRKAVEVEEVTEHLFLDLMQNVNPFMNSRDLWETTCLFSDLTGNAYWYLIRDRLKTPSEIWIIPAQYIEPIPGETPKDFVKAYKFQRGNTELTLPVEDVVHFRYSNPKNQLVGFSPVQGVADAIYLNRKMFEYEEAVFKNKARTGGVLESTEGISRPEMERLRLEWQQKYEGAATGGKTVILPPGMKFTKDSMTPQELAFIDGKKITAKEIAAGFDVPFALYDPEAIRANVDGAQYFHALNGVMPRCIRFQEKLNEQVLPLFDKRLFCAFDDIVPEDKEQLLKEREAYINSGVLSVDEIREKLGEEALPNGIGAIPYHDGRRLPLGTSPPQPGQPVEPSPEKLAEELEKRTMEALRKRLT